MAQKIVGSTPTPATNKVIRHLITFFIYGYNICMPKFYEGDIEDSANTVFVFGSNPLGINGNPVKGTGGAALVAVKNFGVLQNEKMDNHLSYSERAYGLVTVVAPGKRKSLSKMQITDNIRILYQTAKTFPEKDFKIAYRNTDKPSLNGYTGKEMAEMFISAADGDIPNNIWFSSEWKQYFNASNKLCD